MSTQSPELRWPEILTVGLAGLLLYLFIFGAGTLNPTHYAWMMHDDPAQHYLGWQFFRNEPWQWPLGRISRIGLPDVTSIVFTDSIPLLALLLKPFSAWLPIQFQYFGLWMLSCYLLTGYYALRLTCHFIASPVMRVVMAGFFLLSVPLHTRGYGHEALMAQWLLLAAIDLCLGGWQWQRWLVLLLVVALVHPYLLAMCLGFLLAANGQALWLAHSARLKDLVWQNALIFFALAGVMVSAGHIGSGGGLTGRGYGFYSMNMASLLFPMFDGSNFFKDIVPFVREQAEGNVYLGAGVITLGLMGLALKLQPGQAAHPPQPLLAPGLWLLAAVAFGFWLLALSYRVTVLQYQLFLLPIPKLVYDVLAIFRASGRFGWPAFYLLTLAVVVVIGRNLPAKPALAVLCVALALQFGDLHGKRLELRQIVAERTRWTTPLQSPQWAQWASQADTLYILPPHPAMESIYIPFADLAAAHRLATNAAYTARVDPARTEAFEAGMADDLAQGRYNPRTLYVMPQREGFAHLPPALASQVVQLDGYYVLPVGLPTF